ncbi:hypothetical protein BURMUCF1_0420 [Burkholderia multivorans ATCC BAA-247]|uniref:Uncharacterized protein n=1 Tax=Burkholderia multivorans CGD2 TaxID=513052 RepID=B9C0K5_9BURK|nr:hypothetical protein BURMUCGD2_3052 [Burkholderia multivorans CGD2]EEE10245.1 hypothetical protein BURMUCGD2M_3136 [Burkholderia multivorans CGD2M]EJO61076.1 hypothetical protein BURMUCF1_0420 [Burkholderia multivorans ATCC BAA-247]
MRPRLRVGALAPIGRPRCGETWRTAATGCINYAYRSFIPD